MKNYKNSRSGKKSSIQSYNGMHNEHSSRFYSIQRAIIDIEEDLRRIKKTLKNYSGSRKIAFDKDTALKYINYFVESGMIDDKLDKDLKETLLKRAELRELDQNLANKFRMNMKARQIVEGLSEDVKEELREILCGR